MKRLMLAVVLAMLFTLTLAGGVVAGWPPPTVTPVSGDAEFEAVVTDPSKMEGAYLGKKGLMQPSGWLEGDMQFGGKGVAVKGLSYGSARTCFAFPSYGAGWSGNIFRWNGERWIIQGTSIIPARESAPAFACADITSDGVYALIIGFALPMEKANCNHEYNFVNEGVNYGDGWIELTSLEILFDSPIPPTGTKVSVTFVDVVPPGAIDVVEPLIGVTDGSDSTFLNGSIFFYLDDVLPSLTMRVTIGGCRYDSRSEPGPRP